MNADALEPADARRAARDLEVDGDAPPARRRWSADQPRQMSALWTGTPTTVRLDDLEVICVVLQCEPSDLLICEPERVIVGWPEQADRRRRSPQPAAGPQPDSATGMTGRGNRLDAHHAHSPGGRLSTSRPYR